VSASLTRTTRLLSPLHLVACVSSMTRIMKMTLNEDDDEEDEDDDDNDDTSGVHTLGSRFQAPTAVPTVTPTPGPTTDDCHPSLTPTPYPLRTVTINQLTSVA
jgi:hypothetical protein